MRQNISFKKHVTPLDGLIEPREEFWVLNYSFLLESGYKLRPRYDPNWVPSWLEQGVPGNSKMQPYKCLDGCSMKGSRRVLDAIRISDGTKVVLKAVAIDEDVPILRYLNSPDLLADKRNHTVPILDVIPMPDTQEGFAWIVMPFLIQFQSKYTPFRNVKEVVEALEQFLEGLELMHEHKIAHRDACFFNLMMDPTKILPDSCHFVRPFMQEDLKNYINPLDRSSVGPVKYFFIDFETSRQYPPEEKDPRCVGTMGQDRNVPEMSETVPYDPFKLDIYQLGRVILRLVELYDDLSFLTPIVGAMTSSDPNIRPTAANSHLKFQEIISTLTDADLCQRIWLVNMPPGDVLLKKKIESQSRPPSRSIVAKLWSFLCLKSL